MPQAVSIAAEIDDSLRGHAAHSKAADRANGLPGSNYIVNSIEVSGLECVAFDNDIPLKYGVDPCIADTIGPSGLFKGLRTVAAGERRADASDGPLLGVRIVDY